MTPGSEHRAQCGTFGIVASRRSLEDKLARLSELRDEADSEEARSELRRSLADKSPHVVAKAAGIIGELELAELADVVESNFERFFLDPLKSDKGCIAKTAIVRCLGKMERGSAEIFLRGLHHVQMDPAYGGEVDTAVELRGESAIGLVATGYPDTVIELVTALTDPASPVRLAAVRALSATGRLEVEALLRFIRLRSRNEQVGDLAVRDRQFQADELGKRDAFGGRFALQGGMKAAWHGDGQASGCGFDVLLEPGRVSEPKLLVSLLQPSV